MQGDDPPYLPVGTAVSAKYKGAFCEAKVSKVVRCVKCKITFKMGLGTATVTDEQVRGPLRVGHTVQARHSEKKEFIEATITKIQDCSQYTVVFDDGDITTLRRTALCLKSGRHFNESETLDQLPLTHPEHFGNPVVGGRRGRRSRQLKEDSSEGEGEEVTEPDLDLYSGDIGKVVCVEGNDKKKSRDNWFPGLVVVPSAQPTVRINVREEYLVRSFKDGRYYTVPKKEISEFSRDMGARVESPALTEAMEKAIKYLDRDELPVHWERGTLFDLQVPESDSDENFSDSSDDEPREEKDHFVAQLYKFMDDRGTPLNKSPMIANRDVDLYRLFRVVQKLGGYNRVTNQTKWRSVTIRLGYPHNHATYNSVKQAYKKFLFSFEEFYRKLGCTMINHPRNAKKHRGRSLIRDRDRATPVNNSSPRPEEPSVEPTVPVVEKKEEVEKVETPKRPEKVKPTTTAANTTASAAAADSVKTKVPPTEKEPEEKSPVKKKEPAAVVEATDTSSNSSECTVDVQSDSSSTAKPKEEPKKKPETKQTRDKKVKTASGDKVKALVEQFEEQAKKEKDSKKEEDEKVQQTRSKSQAPGKSKEQSSPDRKDTPSKSTKIPKKQQQQQQPPQQQEEDKKRGRKRKDTDTTENNKVQNETTPEPSTSTQPVNVGDKLKVYYGPTHESKVTYEAKVLEIDRDSTGIIYLVHYTGWNTRYDEWIKPGRIAENLSLTTKAKRMKQAQQTPGKQSSSQKPAGKRGRGTSVSSRTQEAPPPPPRSTTPSSVTSSSSRTKSPATPVSKSSSSRVTRHGESSSSSRRTRRNTDFSIASDTDSDQSESESELSRTRSGCNKNEEQQQVKKKLSPPSSSSKRRDDEDTEKEDDDKPKRMMKKIKKSPDKNPVIESDDDDDDSCSPPKGRDFDLNQIRSELKGFEKAVKIATAESAGGSEASASASSSSNEDKPSVVEAKAATTATSDKKNEDKEKVTKQEKQLDKTISTEDIYEFKEPEPFEFEARASKMSGSEDKSTKKRLVPRLFDELEKSPAKKKAAKSPPKAASETKDGEEKKRPFKRSPAKKPDEEEKISLLESTPPSVKQRPASSCEDPFDKLVESPSFNICLDQKSPSMLIATDSNSTSGGGVGGHTSNNKLKSANALSMDETLSLFRELPETVGDDSRDRLDISDTDDTQTDPPLFTHKEPIFSDFNKPETSSIFRGFTGKCDAGDDEKKRLLKDGASDEDDSITAAIQRAISNTMTDEESTEDDLFITQPTSIYQPKLKPKDEAKPAIVNAVTTAVIMPVPNATIKQEDIKEPLSINTQSKEPKESSKDNHSRTPKQISPALQETDSALLEAISLKTEMLKKEEAREPQIKTGTKIADSILQKFNMIKKNEEIKPVVKVEPKVEKVVEVSSVVQPATVVVTNTVEVIKEETIVKEQVKEEKPVELRDVVKEEIPVPVQQQVINKTQPPLVQPQVQLQIPETEYPMIEIKKRPTKKIVSREFIDESDDSSDSEERLVIARSDDDSQTVPSDDKPDFKDTDSNTSALHAHTDDSQEDERNFKLESIIKVDAALPDSTTVYVVQTETKVEQVDAAKQTDDEPDSNISLLLCKETIPGSPAPVPEVSPAPVEPRTKPKSAKSLLLEMPFASAPGSSNSKAMMTASNPHEQKQLSAKQQQQQHQDAQPLAIPLAMEQACDGNETNTVIDNTPPTTPESTMSNMSPRGEQGRISPNTADNESCKSTDSGHRAQTSKITHYSEEDTIMTSEACSAPKKTSRGVDDMPASCRKRRRSCKASDDLPPKRGRRANVRNVRANSDSDDTSEHSAPGSTPPASVLVHQTAASITIETRSSSRSPRPRKYNFVIELDPSLDCGQRISMLQHKLSELRKTYNNVKTELACIDRRRKKLRRREREAMKAAKLEMACS